MLICFTMITISEFQLVLTGTSFELRLLHKNTLLNTSVNCLLLLCRYDLSVSFSLTLTYTHTLMLSLSLYSSVCVCVSFKVFYCVIFRVFFSLGFQRALHTILCHQTGSFIRQFVKGIGYILYVCLAFCRVLSLNLVHAYFEVR